MDDNIDDLMGIQAVAAEVFGTLDTGRQIEPFFLADFFFQSRLCVPRNRRSEADARDPRRDAHGTKDWIHQSDDLG